MAKAKKTVTFKTLGCRLNQAEEESLRRQFLESGWLITDPKNASVAILNSCSVTNQADSRTRKMVRELKKDNPNLKIVVLGCGVDATVGMPEVALTIPNESKTEVLKLVLSHFKAPGSVFVEKTVSNRTRALLKIQDGCNNFCAYCIVPHLRGREVSVPANRVIREAKQLERLGYKELVLTGVNVGKYDTDGNRLIDILRKLLANTDFPRIRLSSVNPQDISEELIELWADEHRLCRHFHLSLQSGSDGVLRRMGRPYATQQYFELVQKITKKMPDVAITTDVIVGFPGETEREFEETIKFIQRLKFAKLHVFRYSKRTGTKAAEMLNQVPESTKKARSEELIRLGEKLHKEFVQKFIGQKVDVLFENKKEDFWYGLTSNYIRIKYKSARDLTNELKTICFKKENIA